jgi:hypothetical protein
MFAASTVNSSTIEALYFYTFQHTLHTRAYKVPCVWGTHLKFAPKCQLAFNIRGEYRDGEDQQGRNMSREPAVRLEEVLFF